MPIAIPQTPEEHIQAIRLYRSKRIGPSAYRNLMERCDDWPSLFELVVERAKELGDGKYSLASLGSAEREYQKGMDLGAHFLVAGTKDYPADLQVAPNRPPFLWAMGKLEWLEYPIFAVIGSRNPSLDGVRLALNISKLLTYEGIVVASGLARGIDASAHEAAITGGTIGVVAGGVDVYYPKANAELQEIMSQEGLVISEMPFGHPPRARDFPRRNRIIAGISKGVLVVEGTLRSGTKLTVNDAEELGRPIFAVPGHPFSGLATLPNDLIANGKARMTRDIDDIMNAMPDFFTAREDALEKLTSEPEPPEPEIASPEIASEDADIGRALIEGRAVAKLDGSIQAIEE